MMNHKTDSIAELLKKEQDAINKDKMIAEQAATIDLLKGCVMELADVVYGEGGGTV